MRLYLTGVMMSSIKGVRLFRALNDINIAKSLSHFNDIVDIYSNSWGIDGGDTTYALERLTGMVLKNAVIKVSAIFIYQCIYACITLHSIYSEKLMSLKLDYIHNDEKNIKIMTIVAHRISRTVLDFFGSGLVPEGCFCLRFLFLRLATTPGTCTHVS